MSVIIPTAEGHVKSKFCQAGDLLGNIAFMGIANVAIAGHVNRKAFAAIGYDLCRGARRFRARASSMGHQQLSYWRDDEFIG
ncbi:hypothetical protein [Micromonospora sp. NPDC085948]|uniref:hypothetical protein n=1 Tax=Micromonospora sp. NPDC085948 TaxID=3155293 RepID=UPI0034367AAD